MYVTESHRQNFALNSTVKPLRSLDIVINDTFLRNGTILTYTSDRNRKLHKGSFQINS